MASVLPSANESSANAVTAISATFDQNMNSVSGQANAIAIVAGDWDGDGNLDLAVANFGGNQVRILANDGTGNFSVSSTIAGQMGATALAAGDWDGDGVLGLAVAISAPTASLF